MKKLSVLASLILMIAFSRTAHSLATHPSFGPLGARTQNPLYLLFLNNTPEAPQTLEKGHFQFSIEEVVSNLLNEAQTPGGFNLDLDMEIYRTALNFAYGVYPGLELGIQIPFLSFGGGFLDGFIRDYHNFFGFPSGGRNSVPDNSFTYRVRNGGKTLYSVGPETFGLSDIDIYVKHQLLKEHGKIPALSLRGLVKFPTGDRGSGLGSGSPDFGLNFSLEKSYKRFHAYTNFGFLILGPFDPLEAYQVPISFTFTQAFEVNMTQIASVVAQVQGNTSLFQDTGTQELDGIPLDLVIGFKGTGPRKSQWEHFLWEFAFSEDLLARGPSVDFSVRFNLGAKF
jgi:hypothetical protein